MQALGTIIWRPLKGHKYRAMWDVGHHWLGRFALALGIAAVFTGIYIAAVGWGYYVAYGATVGVFLVLIGMKDVVDTLVVGAWLYRGLHEGTEACILLPSSQTRIDLSSCCVLLVIADQ